MQEFINTIHFYNEMGQGMVNAREIGRLFVKALESPIKRTESNLMSMAMSCIEQYRPKVSSFERVMRVNMEYVTVPKNKRQSAFEVGRRMTFVCFGDFLLADFFEGIHAGHYPLLCGVCKQYFLQTTAHRRKYCTGFAPGDPQGRSCVAYAARSKRLEKEFAPDHAAKEIYNCRRGTINKHLERGKITKEQANTARRHIENLLDRAITDSAYDFAHYKSDMKQDAVYAAVGIQF